MKKLFLLFAVACLLGGRTLVAQSKKNEITLEQVKITSLKTPSYSDSRFGTKGSGAPWLEVSLEFSLPQKTWVRDLEVHWRVVLEVGQKVYLLKGKTRYAHVGGPKGTHVVAVYIPARHLGDLYDDGKPPKKAQVGARVEVKIGKGYVKEGGNTRLLSEKKTVEVADMLLPRYRTPFFYQDYDYFEEEVRESGAVGE